MNNRMVPLPKLGEFEQWILACVDEMAAEYGFNDYDKVVARVAVAHTLAKLNREEV